jgi:hypothetical protein
LAFDFFAFFRLAISILLKSFAEHSVRHPASA